MTNPHDVSRAVPGKSFRISLWVAQITIFLLFCLAGSMKLTMPVADISKMWPWTGQVPAGFLRFIAVVDFAGGIGILLPAVTRVVPGLSILAALGCTVLQVLAVGFHAARGELSSTPFNFFLLALCGFVLWGRSRKAPIPPRG